MRRDTILSLALAVGAFALVSVGVERWAGARIEQGVLDLGRWAGCEVVNLSGPILWMKPGPFLGDGPKARAFNLLARHARWWTAVASGFATALAVFAAMGHRRGLRIRGSRGPTRCGHCRYILTGLREARCPECGRPI